MTGLLGVAGLGWARGLCWAMGLCFSELGAEAGLFISEMGTKAAKMVRSTLLKGKRGPEADTLCLLR